MADLHRTAHHTQPSLDQGWQAWKPQRRISLGKRAIMPSTDTRDGTNSCREGRLHFCQCAKTRRGLA